jgi:hopanoid biosynthesis associated RND transporter like protein HpnN
MKPLNETKTGRLLHALGDLVLRYPGWFCYPQLLLALVCLGYTVTTLQFSTDKHDLISTEESYWRQFLEFKRDFNIHEDLFVLVESDSREKNREFVERLAARLKSKSEFSSVYYKAELKLMGPKALLFLPEETLAELQQQLATNRPWLQTFSQASNLDALFALVNQQFRLSASLPSGPREGFVSQSLPALQRVLDAASDCLESRQIPMDPNLTTLFGREDHRHELYLTFDSGRIFVLRAQARDPLHEDRAIVQLRKCIPLTQSEVPGVNVQITGEPVLTHDEMKQARRDADVASLLALALTALIFIQSCRDLRRPLMATFCLLLGICYTLGFATLTVGRLNMLSVTLVPILIGLAIDYGVHLIFRYEEALCQGHTRRVAIAKALGYTGVGVVTNALTIAGAFGFMALTDFKGMQEMGVIAGAGVILCLIPMLTLLPLLLVRGEPDQPDPLAMQAKPSRPDVLGVFLPFRWDRHRAKVRRHLRRARMEPPYLKHPWLMVLGGAAFTLFMVHQSSKVQFDYNLLDLQSRGLPSVRMQKQLIRSGSESLLYCAVIADSLPQAVEWERRIKQLPSVARVISLVNYLTEDQERKLALVRQIKRELAAIPVPELDTRPIDLLSLNQTLYSLSGYLGQAIAKQRSDPAVAERLRSLGSSVTRLRRLTTTYLPSTAAELTAFQQRLYAGLYETLALIQQQDDRQRLRPEDVPAFLRDSFIDRSGKFLLQVYPREDVWRRDMQDKFIRELRMVDPNVTGSPVQFYEYTSRLKQNVERAALYAAGIVALLVFLHFHRFSSVLLALLPVALGFCWMLGLMGWLGISFNPVNIGSLILVIGIGVTNGVHILNRFAEEPQPNILARSTGKAVLVSALNTMAGFGSLLVAQHQGIASLGGVMALATGTCVVASLAFLPAVLTLLCRVGWRPTGPPKNGHRA